MGLYVSNIEKWILLDSELTWQPKKKDINQEVYKVRIYYGSESGFYMSFSSLIN